MTPMVRHCKTNTDECCQKVKVFEDFLNKIDENLLFKCEKMEFKKLE